VRLVLRAQLVKRAQLVLKALMERKALMVRKVKQALRVIWEPLAQLEGKVYRVKQDNKVRLVLRAPEVNKVYKE
jgi:hypothetical protein